MLNIQPKQWIRIVSTVNGSLITGAAFFNQLFGDAMTLNIIAVLGLGQIVMSSLDTALSGQAGLVKDVLAMPGVEKISVNEKANPILAAVAVDPTVDKIAPIPSAQDIVTQTARGNN